MLPICVHIYRVIGYYEKSCFIYQKGTKLLNNGVVMPNVTQWLLQSFGSSADDGK